LRRTIAWLAVLYLAATIGIPLAVVQLRHLLPFRPSLTATEVVVYLHETSSLHRMNLEEYVRGVVAAEMPASFNIESLKAQAVAARTYAVARLRSLGGRGCDRHKDADVCTDSTHCQGWLSDDELIGKWGYLDYLVYRRKVSEAVEATGGIILTYEGGVIDPVYHASSGGVTENSEDVWAVSVPYLRSVSTEYEKGSPHYRDSFSFTVTDIERLFGIDLVEKRESVEVIDGHEIKVIEQGNISPESVEIVDQSENGHVRLVRLGDSLFEGSEVRQRLGLPSARFTIETLTDRLIVTTIGYGHGVGMSQHGADRMAAHGHDYQEILRHYYTGVQLAKLVQ
jgi:stage II sporulation protein D